jgi:C_GCAxxG_C_C family probable redox protein
MDRKQQLALDTHAAGFNCAQAVFSALVDGSPRIDRTTALRVSACFGGGMRCGEVCGAVTGALMALGTDRGFDDPTDLDGKTRAAAQARAFHAEFRKRRGTLICRELLGEDPGAPGAVDRLKAAGKMPAVCNGAIADAVDIVENLPV